MLFSRLLRAFAKTPLCTGIRDGCRLKRHSLQNHSSGKLSDCTMPTHSKWNDRGQPSQQTTSPAAPQAEQSSSLSEAWGSCQRPCPVTSSCTSEFQRVGGWPEKRICRGHQNCPCLVILAGPRKKDATASTITKATMAPVDPSRENGVDMPRKPLGGDEPRTCSLDAPLTVGGSPWVRGSPAAVPPFFFTGLDVELARFMSGFDAGVKWHV